MTGRERFLAALNNEKADHLPCQVHSWMVYYLETYLNGIDQYQAYDYFGMDPVIYCGPDFEYDPQEQANWQTKTIDLPQSGGEKRWRIEIDTPEGQLTIEKERNEFTEWDTKHLITSERDFEIWDKYVPLPQKVDWAPVRAAKEKIGDRGITRGPFFSFGQISPWQSFCFMYGTENAIMAAIDKPDWLTHCLDRMIAKKLQVIERAGKFEQDLVETGGGSGSNTVISPDMFRRFCIPYDQQQHDAYHAGGAKTVYHLCGGLMQMLELVVENRADGLETMTPPAMGGDCDLAEATRRVGDKLFFIGGFDQNKGFEKGDPETVRQMVHELHACCPDGGYICSPSDHFFFGDPVNVRAFVDAAKECKY